MTEKDRVPVRGQRYMSEEITDAMLDIGVAPHKLPMCAHRAATHGAGSSVAGIVARAMRANLNFLQNQVDICWGELMHERDFSPQKLEEHIGILGALNLLLFTISADRISGGIVGTRDETKETENILTQTFAKLPEEDVATYNEGIVQLRGILEDDVLSEMMELQDEIEQSEEAAQDIDWRNDIQGLLHMRIGPKLSAMYEEVGKLRETVNSMVGRVRKDWKDDVKQIEADGHA